MFLTGRVLVDMPEEAKWGLTCTTVGNRPVLTIYLIWWGIFFLGICPYSLEERATLALLEFVVASGCIITTSYFGCLCLYVKAYTYSLPWLLSS